MSEKIYFYPVWLRLWHALNAILFIILIITGVSMQYSDPQYPFIPFAAAVSIHNVCGVILSLNYLIFLLGNIFLPNGKYYKMKWKGLFSRLKVQMHYYLVGLFKGEPPPFPLDRSRKFNPLQKFTYILAMYLGVPLVMITGWALLFPEIIIENVFGGSGIFATIIFHIIIGFLLSIFMIVHIYFSTIGARPSANFKAIVTGWHEGH